MVKFDVQDQHAHGEYVPEELQRMLVQLIASATEAGEVLNIYTAADMPKPSLNDLTPELIANTQNPDSAAGYQSTSETR